MAGSAASHRVFALVDELLLGDLLILQVLGVDEQLNQPLTLTDLESHSGYSGCWLQQLFQLFPSTFNCTLNSLPGLSGVTIVSTVPFDAMRFLLAAVPSTVVALASAAVLAQPQNGASIVEAQQTLQTLLDGAITAVRNNDQPTACQLRGQALELLNANFTAFSAAFPTNDWSDLQRSLQGSVNKCGAPGS